MEVLGSPTRPPAFTIHSDERTLRAPAASKSAQRQSKTNNFISPKREPLQSARADINHQCNAVKPSSSVSKNAFLSPPAGGRSALGLRSQSAAQVAPAFASPMTSRKRNSTIVNASVPVNPLGTNQDVENVQSDAKLGKGSGKRLETMKARTIAPSTGGFKSPPGHVSKLLASPIAVVSSNNSSGSKTHSSLSLKHPSSLVSTAPNSVNGAAHADMSHAAAKIRALERDLVQQQDELSRVRSAAADAAEACAVGLTMAQARYDTEVAATRRDLTVTLKRLHTLLQEKEELAQQLRTQSDKVAAAEHKNRPDRKCDTGVQTGEGAPVSLWASFDGSGNAAAGRSEVAVHAVHTQVAELKAELEAAKAAHQTNTVHHEQALAESQRTILQLKDFSSALVTQIADLQRHVLSKDEDVQVALNDQLVLRDLVECFAEFLAAIGHADLVTELKTKVALRYVGHRQRSTPNSGKSARSDARNASKTPTAAGDSATSSSAVAQSLFSSPAYENIALPMTQKSTSVMTSLAASSSFFADSTDADANVISVQHQHDLRPATASHLSPARNGTSSQSQTHSPNTHRYHNAIGDSDDAAVNSKPVVMPKDPTGLLEALTLMLVPPPPAPPVTSKARGFMFGKQDTTRKPAPTVAAATSTKTNSSAGQSSVPVPLPSMQHGSTAATPSATGGDAMKAKPFSNLFAAVADETVSGNGSIFNLLAGNNEDQGQAAGKIMRDVLAASRVTISELWAQQRVLESGQAAAKSRCKMLQQMINDLHAELEDLRTNDSAMASECMAMARLLKHAVTERDAAVESFRSSIIPVVPDVVDVGTVTDTLAVAETGTQYVGDLDVDIPLTVYGLACDATTQTAYGHFNADVATSPVFASVCDVCDAGCGDDDIAVNAGELDFRGECSPRNNCISNTDLASAGSISNQVRRVNFATPYADVEDVCRVGASAASNNTAAVSSTPAAEPGTSPAVTVTGKTPCHECGTCGKSVSAAKPHTPDVTAAVARALDWHGTPSVLESALKVLRSIASTPRFGTHGHDDSVYTNTHACTPGTERSLALSTPSLGSVNSPIPITAMCSPVDWTHAHTAHGTAGTTPASSSKQILSLVIDEIVEQVYRDHLSLLGRSPNRTMGDTHNPSGTDSATRFAVSIPSAHDTFTAAEARIVGIDCGSSPSHLHGAADASVNHHLATTVDALTSSPTGVITEAAATNIAAPASAIHANATGVSSATTVAAGAQSRTVQRRRWALLATGGGPDAGAGIPLSLLWSPNSKMSVAKRLGAPSTATGTPVEVDVTSSSGAEHNRDGATDACVGMSSVENAVGHGHSMLSDSNADVATAQTRPRRHSIGLMSPTAAATSRQSLFDCPSIYEGDLEGLRPGGRYATAGYDRGVLVPPHQHSTIGGGDIACLDNDSAASTGIAAVMSTKLPQTVSQSSTTGNASAEVSPGFEAATEFTDNESECDQRNVYESNMRRQRLQHGLSPASTSTSEHNGNNGNGVHRMSIDDLIRTPSKLFARVNFSAASNKSSPDKFTGSGNGTATGSATKRGRGISDYSNIHSLTSTAYHRSTVTTTSGHTGTNASGTAMPPGGFRRASSQSYGRRYGTGSSVTTRRPVHSSTRPASTINAGIHGPYASTYDVMDCSMMSKGSMSAASTMTSSAANAARVRGWVVNPKQPHGQIASTYHTGSHGGIARSSSSDLPRFAGSPSSFSSNHSAGFASEAVERHAKAIVAVAKGRRNPTTRMSAAATSPTVTRSSMLKQQMTCSPAESIVDVSDCSDAAGEHSELLFGHLTDIESGSRQMDALTDMTNTSTKQHHGSGGFCMCVVLPGGKGANRQQSEAAECSQCQVAFTLMTTWRHRHCSHCQQMFCMACVEAQQGQSLAREDAQGVFDNSSSSSLHVCGSCAFARMVTGS
jgi:hypothetical protein